MLNPVLILAFGSMEDAEKAAMQHICLCRNEDVLLPGEIEGITVDGFELLEGYELRIGSGDHSFLVGYNRNCKNEEMYGSIEITGNPIQREKNE